VPLEKRVKQGQVERLEHLVKKEILERPVLLDKVIQVQQVKRVKLVLQEPLEKRVKLGPRVQ
jgi:hypothetical protein